VLVNLNHCASRLAFSRLLSNGLMLVRIERLAKRRVADYSGAAKGSD